MPAVGADDEIGADFLGRAIDGGAHADDPATLFDQIAGLGMHQEREARKRLAVAARKSRKSHCGIIAMNGRRHRQVRKVGDLHRHVAEMSRRTARLF